MKKDFADDVCKSETTGQSSDPEIVTPLATQLERQIGRGFRSRDCVGGFDTIEQAPLKNLDPAIFVFSLP